MQDIFVCIFFQICDKFDELLAFRKECGNMLKVWLEML